MRNVLITGANSGFGLLTAKTFAEAGDTVFAGYQSRARSDKLFALAASLPDVRPSELDVTDQALINTAVAPEMRVRRRGAIINLSSVVGWLTLAYTSAYGASKHAVAIPAYRSQEFEPYKDAALSRLGLTDWEARP